MARCGQNRPTFKVYFGTKNRKEIFKSMLKWPRNGRLRITESANHSGEEFFLPPNAEKT